MKLKNYLTPTPVVMHNTKYDLNLTCKLVWLWQVLMPQPVVSRLFLLVGDRNFGAMSQVCRRWNTISKSNELWTALHYKWHRRQNDSTPAGAQQQQLTREQVQHSYARLLTWRERYSWTNPAQLPTPKSNWIILFGVSLICVRHTLCMWHDVTRGAPTARTGTHVFT